MKALEMTMACIKHKSAQSIERKIVYNSSIYWKNHEGSILILYFNVILERENIFSREEKNTLMIPSFQKPVGECDVAGINVCNV